MTVHASGGAIFEWVFVVDSTGSMGKELPLLLQSLTKTVVRLQEMKVHLRVGLVAYQDYGENKSAFFHGTFEDGMVSVVDLGTPDRVKAALGTLRAVGGGDRAECAEKALQIASRFDWTPADANGERRCPKTGLPVKCGVILVSDAPPHGLGDDEDNHPQVSTDFVAQVDKFVEMHVPCHTFGVREFTQSKVAAGAYQLMAKRTGGRLVRMESLLQGTQTEDEKCQRLVKFFCNTILVEFEMEAVLQQLATLQLPEASAKAVIMLKERTKALNIDTLDGDEVSYRSLGGYDDDAFKAVTTASAFSQKILEEGVGPLGVHDPPVVVRSVGADEPPVVRSAGADDPPVVRSLGADSSYRSLGSGVEDEPDGKGVYRSVGTIPCKKQRSAPGFQKHTNSERMQALLARRLAARG